MPSWASHRVISIEKTSEVVRHEPHRVDARPAGAGCGHVLLYQIASSREISWRSGRLSVFRVSTTRARSERWSSTGS